MSTEEEKEAAHQEKMKELDDELRQKRQERINFQEELMRSSSLGGQTPLLITALEFAACSAMSVCWLLVNRCSFSVPRWQLLQIALLVLASLVANEDSPSGLFGGLFGLTAGMMLFVCV